MYEPLHVQQSEEQLQLQLSCLDSRIKDLAKLCTSCKETNYRYVYLVQSPNKDNSKKTHFRSLYLVQESFIFRYLHYAKSRIWDTFSFKYCHLAWILLSYLFGILEENWVHLWSLIYVWSSYFWALAAEIWQGSLEEYIHGSRI